jgi:putative FmdB family regulatory protein
MPFYEYECSSCKFYTEVMQKITDAPLEKCPSCGKKALKKLVSAPVFRLKGGGWYETDFKSDKEGKRNLAGAEKEEPKSESKPEAKPAAKETKPAEAPAAAPSAPPAERKRRSVAVAKPVAAKSKAKARSPARKKSRR